jgi:hypothetical protein
MDTEKMFTRALRAIGGTRRHHKEMAGGRWVLVPPTPEYPHSSGRGPARRGSAAERRRRNLSYLAGFIIVTFLVGLVPPLRFLLVANLVADVLLIGYLLAVLYFAARPAKAPGPRVSDPDAVKPPEAAGGWLG